MIAAFNTVKTSLSSAALLSHPSTAAELVVVANASSSHEGAALHQRRRGGDPWQPLGFFSKKLDRAQMPYSAFDRELLAAFSAIRQFRFQVEGRQFQCGQIIAPSPMPSAAARMPGNRSNSGSSVI